MKMINISYTIIFLAYWFLIEIMTINCSLEENKIVAIPYKVFFGAYYFYLQLGKPSQMLFHAIDQEREFTWTSNDYYIREKSTTVKVLKETNLRFRDLNMYGSILEERLNLTADNLLNDFPFWVINNTRGFNSRIGGIGFAYKFRDKRYSIIHRLKEDGQINYLSYSFVPLNQDEGTFYLGGILPNSISNKKQSSCKVTGKYSNWACDLSYVFFGNISYVYDNVYYNNHDYAFFQVGDRRILAPDAFINYLNNSYFQSHILNGECSISISMNKVFECNCDIIPKLQEVYFIFDSKAYLFKASELFEANNSKCTFLITSNHIRDNNWLFGTVFLNRYISLFDYNAGKVTFYSNEEINTIDLDKLFPWKKLMKWSLYVIGIILLAILGRYLYSRHKKRRLRYNKDQFIIEDYKEIK